MQGGSAGREEREGEREQVKEIERVERGRVGVRSD